MTIRFQVGGVTIILQGDPSLSTSLVSLKAMWRALWEQGEGILVELDHMGILDTPANSDIFESLQKILSQFDCLPNLSRAPSSLDP